MTEIHDTRQTRARRGGIFALIAAALLATGIAACGGSTTSTTAAAAVGTNASAATPAATSTPTSTSAPTSTPATTASAPTASATGTARVASPGTSLAAGQPATVPFQTTSTGGHGPAYKLRVTVESIKRGSLEDFSGIQLNATEKASTPYYAKVKITNVGPSSFNTSNSDPAISVEGVDSTGEVQTSVTFFGTFPPCPDSDTPNPFHSGQSVETCLTYLVPGGITKVAYTGTDAYETSPVTWAAK
ncbi:MAG TPA: hypothetical protein VMJ65_09015 [Solirubrobacteraceae bacterium]|nr:hypothetical protein [Solirubrobacteraceae bacterium]